MTPPSLLLFDKPVGLSSNSALQKVRRLFSADKAGHTGTLDPFASGLLPIALGAATKLAQFALDADKTYLATMKLGTVTTTGDPEGEIVSQNEDWRRVSREGLENAFSKFTSVIEQKPPKFSALKYQGKPYYEYARAGIEIPRPARQVEIHRLALRSFEPPYARFETSVSKGTYIRALAEDIGFALGCGASLTELRRTATGGFSIENAFTLEKLQALKENDEKALNATLLPAGALVAHLPRVEVNEDIAERLSHGQRISLFDIGLPLDTAQPVCAVYRVSENAKMKLLGIAEISNGALRPTRWL